MVIYFLFQYQNPVEIFLKKKLLFKFQTAFSTRFRRYLGPQITRSFPRLDFGKGEFRILFFWKKFLACYFTGAARYCTVYVACFGDLVYYFMMSWIRHSILKTVQVQVWVNTGKNSTRT